jgi:signal transduction histidine kinase
MTQAFDLPDDSPADDSSSASLAARLGYLHLTEDDRRRLQALLPLFERSIGTLVEGFYQHLFSFAPAAHFLQNSRVVDRLKVQQTDHFLSLLQAEWGPEYVERRHQVGQTHAGIGIEPQLFLGAYAQYLQLAFRLMLTSDGEAVSPQMESLLSLLKAVFLDLDLTLHAYFTHSTEALRRALEMYLRANLELRQFAHLASHDLKTPLATVANLCDEALDEFGSQMPGEAKQLIEKARARTYRLSKMIDELLSVTVRFDPAESLQETSAQAVIAEAIDLLQPVVQQKQIAVEIPRQAPIVWADPVRLREAVYNILANAVKFVGTGSGRIQVEIAECDEGYDLTIADNGPGIPPQDTARIFAPFQRARPDDDRGGSGLGLYFAKCLMEQQGGRIWVESVVGRGSRFHLVVQRPPAA